MDDHDCADGGGHVYEGGAHVEDIPRGQGEARHNTTYVNV